MAFFKDVEISRPNDCNGFDIVIGNPPYGAKTSAKEKEFYKKYYIVSKTIKDVQKGSTDTFAVFINLGYNLLKKNGNLAFIIPISITSSEAMTGVHNLLLKNCNQIKVSSYAVRPEPVFENAMVNTSIFMFTKTLSECKKLLSTKMHRRKGHKFSLQNLIDNLQYTDVKDFKLYGRIPKIGTEIEKSILSKIFKQRKISDFITEKGKKIFYRAAGGRYFKVITNYSTGSSAEKEIVFEKKFADAIGCILSSNLSFWFYQIYSDNLNWKFYEIENFTIPNLNDENLNKLNNLYSEYLTDIEKNSNVRTSSGESTYHVEKFKEYKIGKSKEIIDKIDDLICPLYGLTHEETEFIKNYEIEFRVEDED